MQFYQTNPEPLSRTQQFPESGYVEEASNDMQPVISAVTQESFTPVEIDNELI